MSKPTFKYDIRKSYIDGEEYTYPAIVERTAPVELKQVIEHAIDRGRIAGIKGTAAASIEEAVLIQIYKELEDGNSVKFDDFFSIRLYLDGQTDANGTLTEDNELNARFINGSELGITRDTFKFEYADGTACPVIIDVKSAADGVPDSTIDGPGDVIVMGSHMATDNPAEELEVVITPVEDGDAIVVSQFARKTPELLRFARPEALTEGKYKVVVRRTDGDTSKVYPSNPRNVTVVGAASVNPEITSATMGEFPVNEVDFDENTPIVLHGVNLTYNAGDGDTLKIELRPDKGDATAVLDQLKSITPSADGTTLSMINEVNTSGKPDGSWWGRDALVTLTTGGKTAELWVKFHDWN